jgi:hypothetical protein
MALIGPLFLLGLLGIGLPIWLHRLETQVTERSPFATTRFLEPAKKRIHVHKKLKYLLLMALRIAFFVILALLFARPVFFAAPQAAITEDTTHHVIVVDTSFSMSADGSYDTALDEARGIINGMGDDDVASLYSASSGVSSIVPVTADAAILTEALNGLAPGNGKLDLGVMVTSLNALIEQSQANFILHVISDFQQSGQAVRFADMIPDVINGRPVTLEVVRVQTQNTPNFAVDSVLVTNRTTVEAGIRGYASDNSERTVTLLVNDAVQQEQAIMANGTGIAFAVFNDVAFAEGDNRIDIRISPVDALAGDDERHAVFDNSPPAPVLLLTADPESRGVTYISAALETAPRGYEVITQNIADLDARILQRYPWIVIEDMGAVNASLAAAITEYVSGGGAVLAGAGESLLGQSIIPVLDLGINSTALRRESRSPITMIDNSHPALRESAGWGTVNMQTLPVAASGDDRLLIAQAGDRPVLIERAIGRGRFMLLTTALDNTLTDLPVKPVFVTFMAEAARYLSNENLLIREQVAESFLQLSRSGGASGQVYDPDGESLLSLSDTTRAQDIALNKTGFYRVITPGGDVLVAVNPDRRESDLTVMDAQVLQNWQNVVAGTAGAGDAALAAGQETAVENTEEREIWRFFLILLVIIVLAESYLGNQHLRVKTGTL